MSMDIYLIETSANSSNLSTQTWVVCGVLGMYHGEIWSSQSMRAT